MMNFDWKNFKLNDFLTGCSNSLLESAGLQSEKVSKVIKHRLAICNNCELGGENATNCHRDISQIEIDNVTNFVNKNVLNVDNLDNTMFNFKKQQEINNMLLNMASTKKHTINPITGQATIGCGCLIKCKIANLSSSCPAQKWTSIE